ncbi:hypothetical protein FKM82_006375 [Ascaphus truei]
MLNLSSCSGLIPSRRRTSLDGILDFSRVSWISLSLLPLSRKWAAIFSSAASTSMGSLVKTRCWMPDAITRSHSRRGYHIPK